MERFIRSKWLLGEAFDTLKDAKILLCGLGGVGGICCDALYRSGFVNITAIDMDVFDISNQNRQLHSENLGEDKAKVFENIYGIKGIKAKIDEDFLKNFSLSGYDIIIDAIDDIKAKVLLAKNADLKAQIFLSSCAAAKRIDASCIKVTDIFKTQGDKFAAKYRYELRRTGLGQAHFDVVFSTESPRCEKLGSFMGVTASFGLMLASLALQKYLNKLQINI